MKPKFLKAEASSVQIFTRSAIESSGNDVGNDSEWLRSIKRIAWEQIENRVDGVRSRTDDTPGGIGTPELATEFSSISSDSSIILGQL